MNRRHRAAQMAGRSSVQLHTLIVFSGENGQKEEDAYVLDVDTREGVDPSFTVIVPRYGIEGRVRMPDFVSGDTNLHHDGQNHRIEYQYKKGGKVVSSTRIQVFDKVRVKIWVKVEQETDKELVMDLIYPKFGGNPLENHNLAYGKKRQARGLNSTELDKPAKKSKAT